MLDTIPMECCNISFDVWLDTFMNYGVYLAESDRAEEAYAIMKVASECNVWHHSQDAMFVIHMTWAGTRPTHSPFLSCQVPR